MTESTRKTLSLIQEYPSPDELYQKLINSKGWEYRTNKDFYLTRDRALVSLLYLGDFRISEVLPLTTKNFKTEKDCIHITGVKVSKKKKLEYREAKLPIEGERQIFTDLVMNYISILKQQEEKEKNHTDNASGVKPKRLFQWSLKQIKYECGTYKLKDGTVKTRYSITFMGTKRAWQIVNAILPEYTQHWLRAFGYNYDYDHMMFDIMAVSDKTKADVRSLEPYLRRRYDKYPVR